MDIEEIRQAKIEAENKIVDILNQLEIESELTVHSVDLTRVEEDSFGLTVNVVRKQVDINLIVV